ncbi:MAG TPA: cupin domain-containing protein [Terriglobia bacterium]|nr:cupin domain-containing protein [Terriglobia bacterium]
MKPSLFLSRSLLCALGTLIFAVVPMRGAQIDPKAITYTLPENIPWQKGTTSDSANLQGDPSKPGLYIQLIKWRPGNMSRPHSHSTARYITVLSGTWWVGTGSVYDPNRTVPMKAGSFVIDQPNELHYDGAKDQECVLYLVGIGPVVTTQAAR